MRTLLIAMALWLAPLAVCSAQEEDRYAGLDSLLTEFYSALVPEDIEVKNAEMDRLIETCHDSLTRQHVTLEIFDHYMHAKIMGEEAVAIHVYDEWIASGKVKMRGEFERMEADIFATFNRNSLIGMKAPEVTLRKPGGGELTVPVPGRKAVMDSDYQLMYGITATPKMYFVLEDGEIIGRRLEVVNLQEIIYYVTLVQNGPEK